MSYFQLLIAVTGSVAAIKLPELVAEFTKRSGQSPPLPPLPPFACTKLYTASARIASCSVLASVSFCDSLQLPWPCALLRSRDLCSNRNVPRLQARARWRSLWSAPTARSPSTKLTPSKRSRCGRLRHPAPVPHLPSRPFPPFPSLPSLPPFPPFPPSRPSPPRPVLPTPTPLKREPRLQPPLCSRRFPHPSPNALQLARPPRMHISHFYLQLTACNFRKLCLVAPWIPHLTPVPRARSCPATKIH